MEIEFVTSKGYRTMWSAIGFISSSRHRESIFLELNLNKRTPKELSGITNIAMPNITKVLKELVEGGFVECLNPDSKRGRLYAPTALGKQVFEVIDKEPRYRDFFTQKLKKNLEEALNRNGIEYNKDRLFKGLLGEISVDFFIPRKNIAVMIRTKINMMGSFPSGFFPTFLFDCGEIKRNYRDVSIVLYTDADMKFIETLKELDNIGHVNKIFIEGEEERLIEFIKKYES